MKKLLLSLAVLTCLSAHAGYTAENKIIKVVIPQPAHSGLSVIYNQIEVYAKKRNINMVPVFKPGAEGKIGISYAGKEKNDGNTLLFSTISDYTISANDSNFDKISPLTKTSFTLVASKKSAIKNADDIIRQEKENPGKLTWGHASSAQAVFIDNFVKVNNLELNKIYKAPFSSSNATFLNTIINGDADLAFILPHLAENMALQDRLTIVAIDEKIKQKMSLKENATGLFLPKNSSKGSNEFWVSFVNDLLNDEEFKQNMKVYRIDMFNNANPADLIRIINNWK